MCMRRFLFSWQLRFMERRGFSPSWGSVMVGCIKAFQRMSHQFLANKTKATSIGPFSIGMLHWMTNLYWPAISNHWARGNRSNNIQFNGWCLVLLFLSCPPPRNVPCMVWFGSSTSCAGRGLGSLGSSRSWHYGGTRLGFSSSCRDS